MEDAVPGGDPGKRIRSRSGIGLHEDLRENMPVIARLGACGELLGY